MFDPLLNLFDRAHQALFETLVQPLLFRFGAAHLIEDAFQGTAWFLIGLLQLVVMLVVIRSLERWRPVEAVTDRAAVREDIVYTLIHRLGAFRLAMFLVLEPVAQSAVGSLRAAGWTGWQLDAWISPWWPGLTDTAWFAFGAYLILFDFVDYLIHRAQHGAHWWWQLHALHHSQRQMTMWSDNRNHLLDDLLRDAVLVSVALIVGIAPAQFLGVVAVTQLMESLSHANVRASFGPVFGRLFVSPAFHRHHHSIGDGHESHGAGSLGGHNFAVLFPVWDMLFRTARFGVAHSSTGIRDQLPTHGARDYGRGFWRQQWLGLARLLGRA
jgi:sterol desaturase/sphingolipid hydroxylase (fatty acid hydroxylase superfamily)